MYPRPVVVFRLGLVLTTLLVALVGYLTASGGEEVLLVSLGVAAFAIAASPVFLQRDYAMWHPVTFVLPLVFVGVTFKIVYVVAMKAHSQHVQEVLLLYRPTSVLTVGAVAMCVGMFCFVLGYAFLPRLRAPVSLMGSVLNRQWNAKGIALVALVLIPISITCFALFVQETGADLTNLAEFSQKRFLDKDEGAASRVYSLKYWYYRGAYLSRAVFYVVFSWSIATGRRWMSWSTIVIVITGLQTLAVPFFSDNRAGVGLLVIDAITLSCLLAKRITATRVLVPIGVTFLLFAVMLANRSQSGALIAVVERTVAGRDFMDVCKTSHIIHAVPNTLPYLYGETLYGWIFAPVPPSVWPNRPRWIEMPFVIDTVFAKNDKLIGVNGMPPGIVAELYMNGGWIAVGFGMVVVGFGFRMILTTFTSLRSNVFAVVTYSLVITRLSMGTFGGDLGTGIVKTALDLLPAMIALFCSTYAVGSRRAIPAFRVTDEEEPIPSGSMVHS